MCISSVVMIKDKFTKIPNIFFDEILREINSPELKILLVIIRQTDGWVDGDKGIRKVKDRITISQFVTKTGLSRKTITSALDSLFRKKLINISDETGHILDSKRKRKGIAEIYYSNQLNPEQYLKTQTCVNFTLPQRNFFPKPAQKLRITKETNTKEKDVTQIKEILDRYHPYWNS